jgi:hypothetical protein
MPSAFCCRLTSFSGFTTGIFTYCRATEKFPQGKEETRQEKKVLRAEMGERLCVANGERKKQVRKVTSK